MSGDSPARDPMRTPPASGGPGQPGVLFFDGLCPLCNRVVRTLMRWDRRKRLRFAPLQGQTAARALAQTAPPSGQTGAPAMKQGPQSVVLWDAQGLHTRSNAILRALTMLGGVHRLWSVLYIVPRPLRDRLYDAIARRRTQWFGRLDHCPLAAQTDSRVLP